MPSTSLTQDEAQAIRENLFHVVHPLLEERPDFPWHRDRDGTITAPRQESSQALALDLFGTIQRLRSRDSIVDRWMKALGLQGVGPWDLVPEVCVPREVLGEPKATQLDVLATGRDGIIAFECKFTEPDGGACSQPVPLRKGANRGARQCNGKYEAQVNPVTGHWAKCALTAKGVRYWEFVGQVMNIDTEIDHSPCPFAGGWYQWMRNLVAALNLGNRQRKSASFVVAYADGPFPMARKVRGHEWVELEAAVTGRAVPMSKASYQELLAWAREAADERDRQTLAELDHWMGAKMRNVAEAAAS